MSPTRLFDAALVLGIALLLAAGIGHSLGWEPTLRGALAGAGSGMALVGIGCRLMPRWWREQANEAFGQPAARNYRRAMFPAMALYVLLLPVSIWLLKQGVEPRGLRALIALLPAAPLAWVMRALLRYVREVDEFLRRVELEAIGVAAMLVSMTYLCAGFLQLARVIDVPAGVAMIWVFPLMALGYGLGKFLALRRYQ